MKHIWEVYENIDAFSYATNLETDELVYMNRKLRELVGISSTEYVHGKCHKVLANNEERCSFCNNSRLKVGEYEHWETINDHLHRIVSMMDTVVIDGGVKYRVSLGIDKTDAKRKEAELRNRDALTGGLNRNGFLCEMELLRAQSLDLTQYAILDFDVKGFKVINELFGSKNSDELVKGIFQFVKDGPLQPKISARIESDHFAFLVSKSVLKPELLQSILHQEKEIDGKVIRTQCICGIYEIEDAQMEPSRMLNNASITLHYVDNDKTQSYKIYNHRMKEDFIDRAEILATYEQAIANQEIKVFYQPIVDASTGKIASAEALVRWQKPNGKTIRPDVFIPTLETNGCISKVDAYVEQTVNKLLFERQTTGRPWVPISVNLSWMDFYDKEFVDGLEEQSEKKNLVNHGIRYEITETAYSTLEGNNKALLEKLKKNGIDIILDDFGSGYSSFGMIKDYSFNVLKIDMSFICRLKIMRRPESLWIIS